MFKRLFQILMALCVVTASIPVIAQNYCSDCDKIQNGTREKPANWSYSQCRATCKKTENVPHEGKILVQGCEVQGIKNLGYIRGNKHDFCLANGWKGGEVRDTCWKVNEGETTAATAAAACPRLWTYYNSADKSCKHLASNDVNAITMSGGKIPCG